MNLEGMTRAELAQELELLLTQQTAKEAHNEALLSELRVHQVELEMQNRELREAHVALEQSRTRFEELYDFAPVAYFTLDLHGCIREVNLTGATMIGRDRARLIGMPFLSVVKMTEPVLFWAHMRRCTQWREPVVSEFSFSTDRLGRLDVQATSAPVLDAHGNVTALRTSFANITDQKMLELDLEQTSRNEKILRDRFEALDAASLKLSRALAVNGSAPDGLLLRTIVEEARNLANAENGALAVGGDPEKNIRVWVFSGLPPERSAAVGPYPPPIAYPAEVPIVDELIHTTRGFLSVPISFAGSSGANLYLTNKRTAEEFSEEDQRVVEMFAERVGVALEIDRLANEVRLAVTDRDNLLAVVSHDLRNPLLAIELTAEHLIDEHAAPEQGQSRRQIELIMHSIEEMKHLINDLLQAATIEAGSFAVETREVDVLPIIEHALQLLEPLATAGSKQLRCEAATDLPCVQGDRSRIIQVLSNLVGNAIKVVPAGGRVTIRTWALGDDVCFSVTDDGPGISAERMTHLFERFSSTKQDVQQGVGLGLFIARRIVEAHGGRIWAESLVGSGSTFYFTIPVPQPQGQHAHAENGGDNRENGAGSTRRREERGEP